MLLRDHSENITGGGEGGCGGFWGEHPEFAIHQKEGGTQILPVKIDMPPWRGALLSDLRYLLGSYNTINHIMHTYEEYNSQYFELYSVADA